MPFDDIVRSGLDGKRQDEGNFDYLNTSARPEAERVRKAIAEWLAYVPEAHRDELVSRIRGSDTQFASATFELFLHAVCLRQGWRVEIHPALSNGKASHPDFRVETPSGSFYLEATLASQFSVEQEAAERRKNEVLRAIDDLPSPNFLLEIDPSGDPQSNVRKRQLRHELRQWLESLDPDEIERRYRDREEVPTHHFEEGGWSIRFKPIPRKNRGAKASRRTIGILGGGVRHVDVVSSLRRAAKRKAAKYGDLDLPLVVAVNLGENWGDATQEIDALFGTLQFWLDRNTGEQTRTMREPNGVWRGPPAPVNTRLSAVWVFRAFDAWHWAARGSNRLYLNPWASRSAPDSVNVFPRAFAVDGSLQEEDGTTFREMFGVSEEWPEDSQAGNPSQ